MSLFTSNRERRLWLWTLVILVAIYSTLSFVRPLSSALIDSGMITPAFILGMLLVCATILTQGLKGRLGRVDIGVALGIVAVYLMVFVRIEIPMERTHIIEYGVVAVFIHQALMERVSQGGRVPVPAILAILAIALAGVIDECIQAVLPSRVFDLRDILFNAFAGLMAIGSSKALTWVHSRKR